MSHGHLSLPELPWNLKGVWGSGGRVHLMCSWDPLSFCWAWIGPQCNLIHFIWLKSFIESSVMAQALSHLYVNPPFLISRMGGINTHLMELLSRLNMKYALCKKNFFYDKNSVHIIVLFFLLTAWWWHIIYLITSKCNSLNHSTEHI